MDLKAIANVSRVETFWKNQIIVSEKDTEYDKMYILLIGEANVYKNYHNEKKTLIDTIHVGAMFGEMSLFTDTPRTSTIVANNDVTAIAITKHNFIKLCKDNPTVIFDLMQTICERLDNLNMEYNKIVRQRNELLIKNNIDIAVFDKRVLFPDLHNTKNYPEPQGYKNFIIAERFTCPNCHNKFDSYSESILKVKYLTEINPDGRKKAIDFEPLWYKLSVCPHCLFTTYNDYLNNKTEFHTFNVEKKLANIRDKVNKVFKFTNNKDLEQVFSAYYLALICADACENNMQIIANLWLELSWLYEDNDDDTMHKYAIKNALIAFKDFFSNINLSKKQDQYYCLIIGTICLKANDYENSFRYLSRVRLNKEGNEVYTRLAEDLMEELKHLRGK